MPSRTLAAVGAAALITTFGAASYAATFLYAYASSDAMEGAFGTLSATANGDGTYTATGGTITAFGILPMGSGALIANPSAPAAISSPSGVFIYDDQLLPGENPSITNPGLLFEIGGMEVNIFSNWAGPGAYEFADQAGEFDLGNFSFSELTVPEAGTWTLMLAGVGIAGGLLRRKAKQHTPA